MAKQNSTTGQLVDHQLNGYAVSLRAEDGYVSATAMCNAAGKKIAQYKMNDSTQEYLEALSADVGIPTSALIQTLRGGNDKNRQGTWVHPKVAIHLAQWLSPQFAVQVTNWVYDWMNGKISAPQSEVLPNKTRTTFNGTEICPVSHDGQLWLTSSDIAIALNYTKPNAVSQLYSRNKAEFDESTSTILKLNVGGRRSNVRVFSHRGCLLVAGFSGSNKALEFFNWVFDAFKGLPASPQPVLPDPAHGASALSLSSLELTDTHQDSLEMVAAMLISAQQSGDAHTITIYVCPEDKPVVKEMKGKLSLFPNKAVKKYIEYTNKAMGLSTKNLKAELDFLKTGSIIDPEVCYS